MSNLKNEEKKMASNSQKGFAQHLLTQEIDSKAKKSKKNSKKKTLTAQVKNFFLNFIVKNKQKNQKIK